VRSRRNNKRLRQPVSPKNWQQNHLPPKRSLKKKLPLQWSIRMKMTRKSILKTRSRNSSQLIRTIRRSPWKFPLMLSRQRIRLRKKNRLRRNRLRRNRLRRTMKMITRTRTMPRILSNSNRLRLAKSRCSISLRLSLIWSLSASWFITWQSDRRLVAMT